MSSPVYSRSNGQSQIPSPASPDDVSSAVKSLLVSFRSLQDVLRQWSVGQCSETEVSDVYVRVGTDLNNAVTAFAYYGIDTSEIHSVPTDLRGVLEQCLGEDPAPEVLERYMPQVRVVLYGLLQALQAKQPTWKAFRSRGGSFEGRV